MLPDDRLSRLKLEDEWEDASDEKDDLSSPLGTVEYIVREVNGKEQVESDPIDPRDEDEFEDWMLTLLQQHPFDTSPTYRILTVDEDGATIEEMDLAYLQELMVEAWASQEEAEEEEWD